MSEATQTNNIWSKPLIAVSLADTIAHCKYELVPVFALICNLLRMPTCLLAPSIIDLTQVALASLLS